MEVEHDLWVLVWIAIDMELVDLESCSAILGIVDIHLSISWLCPLLREECTDVMVQCPMNAKGVWPGARDWLVDVIDEAIVDLHAT